LAALTTWFGAWAILHARPTVAPDLFLTRLTTAPAPRPTATPPSNPYGTIFNPGFQSSGPFGEIFDPRFFPDDQPRALAANLSLLASLGAPPPVAIAPPVATSPPAANAPPATIARSEEAPLPPKREIEQADEGAPLPPVRPVEFGSLATPSTSTRERPPQQPNERTARAVAPADGRTFFERLFGLGQQSGTTVVSATPSGRGAVKATLPVAAAVSGYDRWTAVYDISARTVYLPDGTRLEAHSGLGDRLDDPRYVSERLHGPTPPHLYELALREESFHGVQALRLNPIGPGALFGRAGLLAHTYMLGPNGDSNGCVSFKDYDAFLRAYQSGQVKRLAVVARLG
jgi:hypothetical protein